MFGKPPKWAFPVVIVVIIIGIVAMFTGHVRVGLYLEVAAGTIGLVSLLAELF